MNYPQNIYQEPILYSFGFFEMNKYKTSYTIHD